MGSSTSGLVKAEIIPRDILTGQNIAWVEGGEGTDKGEEEPSSYSGQRLNGLEETDGDGMGQWCGYYPAPLGPEIFFWTDRGWRCLLLRNLAMVS